MFAHPDGDHMTLLNIFRGYAAVLPHDVCSDFSSKDRNGKPYGSNRNSSTAARSWCDEHFLSLKVLERAAEIRTRLRGMIQNFVLREKSGSGRRTLASSQGSPEESALIRR